MSCPYFYPVEPRTIDSDPQTALLPLGNLWDGFCRAVPGRTEPPEEAVIRPLCHLGYARSTCTRFPTDDPGPDAVRFTISRDDGRSLYLNYVLEQDHHPFAHGPLEYSIAAAGLVQAPPSETVCRQAEAYITSYLQRKARVAASI